MKNDTLKKAKDHLTTALVFHTDIVAERARGLYVTDLSGREYMDFSSGLATANVGHCHPKVVEAAKAQTEKLIHSGCIFYHDAVADLAERLAGIAPGPVEMFFFSNSGAEAVEGAVKLARHSTGRQGVVAFTGGFHGRTTGALALTSSSSRYKRGYLPLLPSVYHAPYPYCYRCPVGMKPETCSVDCLRFMDTIFDHHLPPDEVACVVIEPVLGEGGYVPAPAKFLTGLKELCSTHGILFVADEVQTGFGRTGRWFACEHSGVEPDIITMAKGIASGFPLSVVGSTKEIMSKWPPGAHGTTFGGNPVSCAAAVAAMDAVTEEGMLANAVEVGARAMGRLKEVQGRCPSMGDVRGLGLMIGVEFVAEDGSPDPARLERVMKRCLDKGLIIIECGTKKNIARLMPPLNTTAEEMDRALAVFEEALFE